MCEKKTNVPALFGRMVFDEQQMQQRLSAETYQAWQQALAQGTALDRSVAGEIASAMKDWAIEKGATHFTHWFQPMTGFTAEKHDSFITRDGNAQNPVVLIQANSIGKLDVAGAIGKGVLSVIKDIGLKDPYVGQTDLVSGEIAEDLTYYFAVSEQTPSSVGLGVLMNKDNTVRQAGGFIIQLMPDASEETISALEKRLAKVSSVTAMLDSGKTPEDILQELLGDMELAVLDRLAVSFKCGCSKERFARGIASIKKSDIQEMIDAGENIETCCQFCNSKYVFTPDELKEMM